MRTTPFGIAVGLGLALSFLETADAADQRSRRSQRVKMEQVQVTSPDGQVRLTVLPNSERLTFTVTMGETTVIEPSAIVMKLDGYDLSSGVVFTKAETYQVNETRILTARRKFRRCAPGNGPGRP